LILLDLQQIVLDIKRHRDRIAYIFLCTGLSSYSIIIIQYIIFDKFSANSFQIKLKDISTTTNLLDEALLEDLTRVRREERKGSILLEISRVID